jgi:hypothetical protein
VRRHFNVRSDWLAAARHNWLLPTIYPIHAICLMHSFSNRLFVQWTSDVERPCIVQFLQKEFTLRAQRPVLNLAPRGKLWPPGAKLSPRSELCPYGWSYPLGVKFSVHPFILLNSREYSPLGINKGVNIPPRGQSSPLGAKFTSRVKLYPWGQTMLLKTGRC